MDTVEKVFAFLAEHMQIIGLLMDLVTKGVTKETIVALLQKALIEASDAEMKREFPNENP